MSDSPYLFVFGRTPALSFLELQTFFPGAKLVTPDIAMTDVSVTFDPSSCIEKLGGTVKIARMMGVVHSPDASITQYISHSPSVTFGVSAYGDMHLPKTLLSDMKHALESQGVTARYVAPHDGETLSSVTIDKRHVEELILFASEGEFVVGKTIAIQNYDAWSKRDYGRPRSDAKSGMLPLKVARMLVNIANNTPYNAEESRQKTLYDPFCGMGTILSEGYLTGCRVLGSDVSDAVVAKAKINMDWLVKQYLSDRGSVAKIFTADAVHASELLPPKSVHAIVTEPFMGSTGIALEEKIDMEQVRNKIKGLEKLYIGCLRNWLPLLAENAKVIIALPSYAVNGRVLSVKKVVDMCEILGYTIEDGPIEYSRPQAVVRRNFYILQKK